MPFRPLPLLALLLATPLAAQPRDRAAVARAVDAIVADALKDGRAAGMSVAVVRGADTIVMKGYGRADVELDVPTPERAVYEIGSVTKQFTAAAVLQLQEQGKLSLDDELTKHLPGYPTQGHRVTLRRLLDHTSGIRGYTEIPEFNRLAPRDLPRDSLVALFSARPFDFAPGDAMAYNNSAYFLLGLVVEKASGMPYARYVKQQLFDRAGMPDSHYCSNRAIVPRRAHGYEFGPAGLVRASYMDHTWPFAAGSLCSTVGDLVAWTRALHGGRILGADAYRQLVTPDTLNDGTLPRYAKGLVVGDSIAGRRAIHHGGGIPGFLADLAWFPDDSLVVAVLANTAGPVDPAAITARIAAAVYGEPAPPAAAPFAGRAADYAGEYRGEGRGRELVLLVAADSAGQPTLRVNAAAPRPLRHLGGERFAVGGTRLTFVRENGRVTKVRVSQQAGYTVAVRKE